MIQHDGQFDKDGNYYIPDMDEDGDYTVLTHKQFLALKMAANELLDEWFNDLNISDIEDLRGSSNIIDYLPPRYRLQYNWLFVQRMIACLMLVTWKLFDKKTHMLASVAEELCMRALLDRAEEFFIVAEDTKDDDGGMFPQFVGHYEERHFDRFDPFEDCDYEFLFDDSFDGIEDTITGSVMGIANLKFDEWFKPFNNGRAVIPFCHFGDPDYER